MKRIPFDTLKRLPAGTLSALFRAAASSIAQNAPDSPERRSAQAMLDAIRRVRSARRGKPPAP